MEGILAEKDAFVSTEALTDLRDLDVLRTGMMNARFEITVLDQFLVLGTGLDHSTRIITDLEANRQESKTAITKMKATVERRRTK